MALLCSQFPFTASPSRRVAVVPNPLVSETLVQRTIALRAFATGSFHCKTLQLLRCCASSDSSSENRRSSSARRIFIKGLPQSITEGFLGKKFSDFGKVDRVKIVRDKKSGDSLGFAYVWFNSEEAAELATIEMDGKFFGGRFIVVTIARPESPTSQVRATPHKF